MALDYVIGADFGDLPFKCQPIVPKDNSPVIHDMNGDLRNLRQRLFYFMFEKMGKDNDNNLDHTMKWN